MSITGSPASCWGDRSTKRLVLELELRAQRLLELKPVHIRIMDRRQNYRGFIVLLSSIRTEKMVRSKSAAIRTKPRK